MKSKKLRTLFSLFKITFSISAFTFGGGYIVIPMMRKYFVDDLGLISEEDLMDMSAIAHSTPGAIAVNIAVLVGYKTAGITGAIISGLGTITPPLIILSIISIFYKSFRDNIVASAILRGMEAGVAASIIDILMDMWQGITREKNLLLTLMVPATFIANYVFNINVIYIIVFCAILCLGQTYIGGMFLKKEDDGVG